MGVKKMPISGKELMRKKATAKLILEAKGLNFDEWLAQKYDEVFRDNEDVIQKALKSFKEERKNGGFHSGSGTKIN